MSDTRILPIMLTIGLGAGVLTGQTAPRAEGRMVDPGTTRNGNLEDEAILAPPQNGGAGDALPPGSLPKGSPEAAARQAFILEQAAKVVSGKNRKPEDRILSQWMLTPTIDPKTGLVKEDADEIEAEIHNRKMTKAPDGRRARLAEFAGLSPEEVAQLFPITSGSYATRDVNTTDPTNPPRTQEDVVRNLVPGQNLEREELVRNAVLTDGETSFAVYAGLGMPFPIRVGKLDMAGTTRDGIVLFSPELLRADVIDDRWTDLQVSYRFMNGTEEVSRDTIHVRPFKVIPRPSAPVTHLWVTCDQDVMAYALRGVARVPGTVSEARDQIQSDVVQVNSWLRVPTKLYGIRWGVLPTVNELTKNQATRDKLAKVLAETGLLQRTVGTENQDELAREFREMADKVRQVPLPQRPNPAPGGVR